MKTVFFLIAALISTVASANFETANEYYAAKFRITKISPMCPTTVPNGASCFGLGSIVHVEAVLGCGDELLFAKFDEVDNNNGTVDLFASSLVRTTAKPGQMRCMAITMVKRDIPVHALGKINLINVDLKAY